MPSTRQFTAISLTLLSFIFPFSSMAEEKPLIVTGSSTWQPFSFINKEGDADGIMVDYWQLYAKANNLDVQFNLLPWSESLTYVANTDNVVHGGLGYTGTRAETLAFSRELPLKRYNVSLFVQKDLPFDDLNLLDSAVVGTVKESTKHAFLMSRIPEENIKLFPTFGSLNDAAYKGDVDIFIDDFSTALYDMRHTGNAGQFTARRKLYSFPLHFAVNKGSQNSLADIEQGLDKIAPDDIQAIYDKWLPQNKLHSALPWLNKHAQLSILIGSMLIMVLGLLSYRKLLRSRTEELKSAVEALKSSEERLECVVQSDTLTGAKTRHQFYTLMADKRFSPSPYVVAVLDIDSLKQINESFGQDVGDMALRHLTKLIRLQFSDSTVIARLGGGEFAVLFDLTESTQAMKRIRQLKKVLQLSHLHIDQQIIPVTFSEGIACYPYDGEDGETLVTIATTRMRANKPYSTVNNTDNDANVTERRWA